MLSNTSKLEREIDYQVWYLKCSVPANVKHANWKCSGEFAVVLFLRWGPQAPAAFNQL